MKVLNIKEMHSGWFIGNFTPSAYKTDSFEVCYRIHPKGEQWPHHYHEYITEINLLIKGEMILQKRKLKAGDIFILYPFEIADPIFLEDCEIVCVKTPSTPGDKIIIEEKSN